MKMDKDEPVSIVRLWPWLGILVVMMLHCGARAQSPMDEFADVVQPEIVSDAAAVEPGKPFRVGVRFKIKPEWHIYWKNPGESGFATTVKWDSPAEVKFDELQYPAPIVFESPGPLMSYGYEHEVLLFSEARLPEGSEAKEIEITANVRWLMCSDRCVPGKKELRLKLPVGSSQAAEKNQDIFQRYAALVPSKEGDAKVKTAASSEKGKVTVKVDPAGATLAGEDRLPRVRRVYFFPEKVKGYNVGIPEIREPDSSAKLEQGGNIKAYEKPVSIEVEVEPTGEGTGGGELKGVVVYQPIENGKPATPQVQEMSVGLK